MKILIALSRARKVLIHVQSILKASRARQRTLRLVELKVLFRLTRIPPPTDQLLQTACA